MTKNVSNVSHGLAEGSGDLMLDQTFPVLRIS